MLNFDVEDTIVAVGSPAGGGLRGVIRLSGQNCLKIVASAFKCHGSIDPAHLGPGSNACTAQSRTPINRLATIQFGEANSTSQLTGDLLVWPSKKSYTRQPSAEFHTLGCPPLLAKVIRRLCELGARIANPGEFTLRAFLSGRLDLPQAEAVLSIIDAQADSQLKTALRQLAGGLSSPLANIRKELLFLLAEIEAGLDFVDEDIQFISPQQIASRLSAIELILETIAAQIQSRDIGSEVLRVALIGLPNTGKSTLFNELLGEQRAIVSKLVGTTTDYLVGLLDLDGIPVELIDTAGFESTANDIVGPAATAQQVREQIQSQAHLTLLCLDSSRALSLWEIEHIQSTWDCEPPDSPLLVLTKSDLKSLSPLESLLTADQNAQLQSAGRIVEVAVPSFDQLRHFKLVLREHVMRLLEAQTDIVPATCVRTRASLESARSFLTHAKQATEESAGDELIAADLRSALQELGTIVGSVYTDDILDVVFSRFCIGK